MQLPCCFFMLMIFLSQRFRSDASTISLAEDPPPAFLSALCAILPCVRFGFYPMIQSLTIFYQCAICWPARPPTSVGPFL